jgi:omega-3 fatty acid desaturase (delta-15 desaturase)
LVVVRNVAGPLTLVPEPETPEVVEVEEEEESGPEFDLARKPPFTLSDIRAAIPKHCWEKNTWKSLSYVTCDVALVFALAAGAAAVNSWLLWPLYWVAQGSLF